MRWKGQSNAENSLDEPLSSTAKKRYTISQYIKEQDLETVNKLTMKIAVFSDDAVWLPEDKILYCYCREGMKKKPILQSCNDTYIYQHPQKECLYYVRFLKQRTTVAKMSIISYVINM
jgi:hypothetical protein